MPPLATRDDVARVLRLKNGIPEDQEANVDAALEVAEDWAKRYLKSPGLGEDGSHTTTKSDVPVDGYITVPGPPVSVSVVYYAGAPAQLLGTSSWTYDGRGVRLRMGWDAEWYDPRYGDLGFFRRAFAEVQVVSNVPGTISPTVRDGVAYAAAALWTRGPRAAKGMKSENIGDYGYTLMEMSDGDPFYGQAKAMLRPLRPSGISAT